jgi:hypothetical protein
MREYKWWKKEEKDTRRGLGRARSAAAAKGISHELLSRSPISLSPHVLSRTRPSSRQLYTLHDWIFLKGS